MTQEYIGTKIVTAWPSLGNPSDPRQAGCDGYAVKYPDGYTSWSPAAAFEAAYLPIGQVAHLPAWRQRLAGEHVRISSDVEKLSKFIGETNPTGEHGTLLQLQLEAMIQYRDAVGRRIELLAINMGLNPPATNTGD